jgi:hypothetical protein
VLDQFGHEQADFDFGHALSDRPARRWVVVHQLG